MTSWSPSSIPPSRWVVGVSGGADSVALLRCIVADAPHVTPIVAHLNHESRSSESDADAAFVVDLARRMDVPSVVARRSDFASCCPSTNLEAAYRAARHALFAKAVNDHDALGVLLAHHADDRAETVLLRLLRGGEPAALAGLRREARVGGIRILRPLLEVRRRTLETYLTSINQSWRTDASNASMSFARNRVRRFLGERPEFVQPLLQLADAADAVRAWIALNAPSFGRAAITASALAELPDTLARHAARDWLTTLGAPRGELSIAVVGRLIAMARDRATPSPQTFPGTISVARSGRSLVPR